MGGGGGREALCHPPSFVVSSSIMIKFGKFSLNDLKNFKNDVTAKLWRQFLSQAMKFRTSLFLDEFG